MQTLKLDSLNVLFRRFRVFFKNKIFFPWFLCIPAYQFTSSGGISSGIMAQFTQIHSDLYAYA